MKGLSEKPKLNIINTIRILCLYLITLLLTYIVPKDKNRICFTSRQGTNYGNNSKYLYEYFKKDKKFKSYYLLSDKKKAEFLSAENNDLNIIYMYSTEGLIHAIKSKVLVMTHGTDDFLGIFPNFFKQKIINLGHGIPTQKIDFLSDTSSKKHLFKVKVLDSGLTTALFTTSDFAKYFYVSRQQYDPRKIFITGFPKNDLLFGHKKKLKKDDIKILYAPTWKKDECTNLFPFADFDRKKLVSFLEKNNIKLFLRFHPNNYEHSKAQLQKYKNCRNILDLNFDKLEDIHSFLNEIDILLTDYSGLAHDFLALDRPTIYIYDPSDNIDKYVPIQYELCFPGARVNSLRELLNTISYSIKNPKTFSRERDFTRKLLFNHLDDKSCYRAKKLIQKLIQNDSHI